MKLNNSTTQKSSGFTLIELVMVIMLIGILSFGGISLFSSRDAYAGYIAKEQLTSSALLAQQMAMGMSASNNPVTLVIERDASDIWHFRLTKTSIPSAFPQTVSQAASGTNLIIDGVTLGKGDSRTFSWDSRANLSDGLNHEVRFVGESNYRVCISGAGYAYESQVACP